MDSPSGVSEAARFNKLIMRKLNKALAADPEIDLVSVIPSRYSGRLASRKAEVQDDEGSPPKARKTNKISSVFSENDIRSQLDQNASTTVLFPLSEPVKQLLGCDEDSRSLASNLVRVAREGNVMWQPRWAGVKMLLECPQNVALKVMINMDDMTEYTALQYLREKKPTIPVPEPLGLVRLGESFLMFMSLIPGESLERIWPHLDETLKHAIQTQLNDIFMDLRSLPHTTDTPLGGVGGEGCKDLRRHVRHTDDPIWTVEQFDDWQFSNPHFGSPIYIEVVRRLSPPLPQRVVFSHNDLRMENILVNYKGEQCHITGIVDWEYSGFYPEYYECTKVMNSIRPYEDSDWFLYIPDCISPLHHPQKWLLDAIWWKHVE